jgi:ATP-dependent DNA helicase DinG
MATAVTRALAEEHVLFCEAGTGTGKSFAYLVPALLSGKKVVISTATRALQDQLLNHDVPLVERALGRSVAAVGLKGLGNYVCRRRLHEWKSSRDAVSVRFSARADLLSRFADESDSGDIAELSALSERDEVFAHVVSGSDTRVGSRCPHYEQCFVTQARRRAEAASIVVTNHHLFFADLALRGPHPGRVLPDYDAVVFDEAHQIEDVATAFFGERISEHRIGALVSEAERALSQIPSAVLSSQSLLAQVRRDASRFFDQLRELAPDDSRVRADEDTWLGPRREAHLALDTTLLGLEAAVDSARADPAAEKTEAVFLALESVIRRARATRDALCTIIDGSRGRVSWIETNRSGVTLSSSPVDVSEVLRERIFDRIPSVVLTSATLATHGDAPFAFVRRRLGADQTEAEVRELVVDSPFDFRSNALLYLAKKLPPPGTAEFMEAASAEIAHLVEASDGGAFLLCTSLSSMAALHRKLRKRVGDRPLLLQGEAPKNALLERFQTSRRAVLVATQSFWEGVDVPGHALRLVVLEKVPFSVPTDPLVQARAARIEQAGGQPFRELFVPTAQMMLKQGFGRLIRTRDDKGVVALLDSRVLSKGYGQSLLAALPPAKRVVDIDAACRFLHTMREAEP